MPKGQVTPLRSFRCPDEIWLPAQEKAKAEGRDLSDALREMLTKWVGRPPRKPTS